MRASARDSWLPQIGVVLIAAKVALVPIVVDLQAADVFTIPKVAVSRALLYVTLLVLAAYALRRGAFRWTALWFALTTFLLVEVAATTLAVHPYTALHGAPRRLLGLTTILDGAAFAVAIAVFLKTTRDLVWLSVATLGSAAVVFAYGAIQAVGLDPVGWSDPMLGSTIGNTGAFAGYALVVSALALCGLLLSWLHLREWQRAAIAATCVVGFAEVLVAGARGPALALPVVAIGAVVLGVRSRSHGFPRPSAAALAIVAVSTAVFLALAVVSPAGARVARLLAGGDTSTTERTAIYRTAVEAVRSRALLGAGPDSFVAVYLSYRPPETAELGSVVRPTQTSTHSWVFHQAVGGGLLGLFAFLALAGVALIVGWRDATRSAAAALGATGLVSYLAQGLFSINHVAVEQLLWLSVGLIASRGAPVAGEPDGATHPWLGRDARPTVVAAAIGLALALTVANSLLANRTALLSSTARDRGSAELAAALAERATQLDGRRAEYWSLLGLARAKASPASAMDAFERAAELAPYDSNPLLDAARQGLKLAALGSRFKERTLSDARRAVELDPQNPAARVVYAYALLDVGDADAAAEQADHAIAQRPGLVNALSAYVVASDAYRALKRDDVAVERLRAAHRLAQASRSELEPSIRLDLARLLVETGRVSEMRELVAPPRVKLADRGCEPTHGYMVLGPGQYFPRCVRVSFAAEEALVADPARADSATNPGNYEIDARPLPPGSTISYDERRQIVIIQLPPDTGPPRRGAIVSVTLVADLLGNVIYRGSRTSALDQ